MNIAGILNIIALGFTDCLKQAIPKLLSDQEAHRKSFSFHLIKLQVWCKILKFNGGVDKALPKIGEFSAQTFQRNLFLHVVFKVFSLE